MIKRLRKLEPTALAVYAAVLLVFMGVVIGALAVPFDAGYDAGDYVHDIAILVLGLGAVTFAARDTSDRWRRAAADSD